MNDAKEIFFGALDQGSSDELAAYLDQECGGDVRLRARVEELLRAHREAGSFLTAAEPVTEDSPRAPDEGAGAVIGPYKLLEQIGEGGFGVVYMAEQERPVRRSGQDQDELDERRRGVSGKRPQVVHGRSQPTFKRA